MEVADDGENAGGLPNVSHPLNQGQASRVRLGLGVMAIVQRVSLAAAALGDDAVTRNAHAKLSGGVGSGSSPVGVE